MNLRGQVLSIDVSRRQVRNKHLPAVFQFLELYKFFTLLPQNAVVINTIGYQHLVSSSFIVDDMYYSGHALKYTSIFFLILYQLA